MGDTSILSLWLDQPSLANKKRLSKEGNLKRKSILFAVLLKLNFEVPGQPTIIVEQIFAKKLIFVI